MEIVVISLLDGVVYGILFMLACGLTLGFGMLGVINVARAATPMLLQQFPGEIYWIVVADRGIGSPGIFTRRARRARTAAYHFGPVRRPAA